MTVRLRPHHLLCLLTYVGEGYSAAFTANLTAVAARLSAGEEAEIVHGPDDVCAPLLADAEPHCHDADVADRDRRALEDVAGFLGGSIAVGARMTLHGARVDALRAAFAAGTIRMACGGCAWSDLCGAVSTGGYAGARLAGSTGAVT